MLQRVELVNDETGERIDVGLVGDFAAAIVDQAGREFVKSMVSEMGSVTTVFTRSQFAYKADAAFDRIEAQMKDRSNAMIRALIQKARDSRQI